jgi:undecaprenyl phosphate N,N'-diacetylbacillosamine 1-phosphate transferase
MYKLYIKRIFDFFVASIGFLIIFPIFIIFFVWLTINNKGKSFFIQNRLGNNGCIFKVIKFKTMNDKKNKNGQLLADSERLTKIGRFIRKTSLDEIPQLINVIKGDMSLVGPRPLLVEYLPLYNDFQKRRHEVRPGITGWAQVNGRNAISWEKRFELDVWYVDNLSFWLDIKILFMTIKKVFIREGISSGSSATMEKFKGTP